MSLTVRALTEIPYLRTRLHAGASGADRPITWAHSIELPEPWEWLESGDLLMTVGLGIPAPPEAQVAYVEHLAAVGVSGVAIGEDMSAPPLSSAMLAAADARGLPLLFTAYEVPFVQLGRAVAASRSGPEQQRLVRAMRVYDELRASLVEHRPPAALLDALGSQLDAQLVVCDRTGHPVFGGRALPDDLRDAYVQEVAGRDGPLPAILRLEAGGRTAVVVRVPSRRSASLVAVHGGGPPPSFALLQHVATAAALEVERLAAAREELRRLGSETFAQLLDARLSPAVAAVQLRHHGFADDQQLAVLALSRGEQELQRSSDLHHVLAEHRVPNLLLRRTDVLLALVPADEALVDRLAGTLLDPGLEVGISEPFGAIEHVPDAVRQARWALAAPGARVTRYGASEWLFGPRSLAEARVAVERVLGPVLEYDAANGTQLLPSLVVFLRCNRSWRKATAELFVHRQTLVYRMRRVEELSGRSLSSTSDVTDLWLALRALELLD